jgi:hypothetical protein
MLNQARHATAHGEIICTSISPSATFTNEMGWQAGFHVPKAQTRSPNGAFHTRLRWDLAEDCHRRDRSREMAAIDLNSSQPTPISADAHS